MPEAADSLVVIAGEYVSEVADAEAHFGAKRGREELARDFGRVDRRRRLEAIVAVSTPFGRDFAEVLQQDRAAAGRRLDEHRQCIEPLALGRPAFGIDLLLDPLPCSGEVLRRPEEPGFGGLAVAAGAAGLL